MRLKSIIITTFLIFFYTYSYTQKNTYQIINQNNVTNISDYNTAMDSAKFDSYRYIKKRRKLVFASGVEIELLSVHELQKLNIPVNSSKGRIYNEKVHTNPIFRLGPNGYILAEINNSPIKK